MAQEANESQNAQGAIKRAYKGKNGPNKHTKAKVGHKRGKPVGVNINIIVIMLVKRP